MFVPRIEIEPVVSEIELLALLMLSSYVLYNSQNFVMFKANESHYSNGFLLLSKNKLKSISDK